MAFGLRSMCRPRACDTDLIAIPIGGRASGARLARRAAGSAAALDQRYAPLAHGPTAVALEEDVEPRICRRVHHCKGVGRELQVGIDREDRVATHEGVRSEPPPLQEEHVRVRREHAPRRVAAVDGHTDLTHAHARVGAAHAAWAEPVEAHVVGAGPAILLTELGREYEVVFDRVPSERRDLRLYEANTFITHIYLRLAVCPAEHHDEQLARLRGTGGQHGFECGVIVQVAVGRARGHEGCRHGSHSRRRHGV